MSAVVVDITDVDPDKAVVYAYAAAGTYNGSAVNIAPLLAADGATLTLNIGHSSPNSETITYTWQVVEYY
ncbi:MAG: hypothetical protein PHH26_00665 [Candidatus Thermoplasmatota archaeon]|nr:hypothetical protein [Candidatus Thermoplasmatota archaeon]